MIMSGLVRLTHENLRMQENCCKSHVSWVSFANEGLDAPRVRIRWHLTLEVTKLESLDVALVLHHPGSESTSSGLVGAHPIVSKIKNRDSTFHPPGCGTSPHTCSAA